jgi:glycosyltransferase involved in cell wall biosynthesis
MRRKRRIVYVQYTSPAAYPPLEHSSHLLVDEGWEVLFLGTRKHDDPPLDWQPRPGISLRELPPSGPGWLLKLHYAWFSVWVVGWVAIWRPSWLYVSDALACPVALALTFWPGLEIVYHEHDAPQVGRRGIFSRMVLWTRRKCAVRAQVRVLPNETRAEHFNRYVANHRPTFSVWNCPRRTEISKPRGPSHVDRLQVLYVGSIVPFRLPTSVIHALALLPDEVHLRVIGYPTQGHPDYVRELRDLARQLGVARRTQFVDAMPHRDLLVTSREADVGLVLMPVASDDESHQWMPGASNKPFDYLASGLALLVSDLPGWREMFVEPGYGLACQADDPQGVATALRWFVDHPTELRAMGERGRRRVATEWNYETQFSPVRDWLDANCHSRARPV